MPQTTHTHHIAEINLARMLAPLDDPIMVDFVANLDRINAIAEGAQGFVWRLQTEQGDATDIRVVDDDYMLINMSVWERPQDLHHYTYYSLHVEVYRRRREWFEVLQQPLFVMWWVPAGHIPSITEGLERLDHFFEHGPTPAAFDFRPRFSLEEWLDYAGEDTR